MPLTDYPKIQHLIDGDYNFRFATYVEEGFELFVKYIFPFIGATLLFVVLSIVSGLLPIIGQLINSFVSPILAVGFYIVARKIQIGEEAQFGNFFDGFKYFPQIAMRVIAGSLIMIIVSLPFLYLMWDHGLIEWYMDLIAAGQDAEEVQAVLEDYMGFPLYSLFLLLPAVYLGVAYSWADMFIVFKGMSFWDAMEASRQLISKKWFLIFSFSFVLVFALLFIAIVTVCVGFFFAFPVVLCMSYAAFADVVGLNDDASTEDDILDHLVSE